MSLDIIYLLNAVVFTAIAVLCFYIFFSFHSNISRIRQIGNIIGVSGIFYLTFSFLNLLWVFRIIEDKGRDFILVYTFLTLITAVLMLYTVYKITDNRNLIYILLLFIISFFSIIYISKAFFLITIISSYLLLAIVFLQLMFVANIYLRDAGYLGVGYILLSTILLILTVFGADPSRLVWFIPNIILFCVFLFLFLDIKNQGVIIDNAKKKTKNRVLSFVSLFLKFSVFIISLVPFVLLSTIAIHEVGHSIVAQYYECEYSKSIVYDILDSPHTEIRCSSYYNDIVLTAGGIIAPMIIAVIFLLLGGNFTRDISSLMLGFGLLISYGDLSSLSVSEGITTSIMILGYAVILISIVNLSVFYLKQNEIFRESLFEGIKKIYKGEPEVRKIVSYNAKIVAHEEDVRK